MANADGQTGAATANLEGEGGEMDIDISGVGTAKDRALNPVVDPDTGPDDWPNTDEDGEEASTSSAFVGGRAVSEGSDRTEGSRPKMKKDDSGICVERAADEEHVTEEELVEAFVEEYVESGKGKGLAKIDVKNSVEQTSEKSSPDSGHHESELVPLRFLGDVVDGENADDRPTTQRRPPFKTKQRDEDAGDDVTRDDETKADESVHMSIAWDDDSSNDGDDNKDENEEDSLKEKKAKLHEHLEEPRSLAKMKPKYKWFLCQEVVQRQYGSCSAKSSDLFRLQAYGSLHMVERLELMRKMKGHEGCVNTLHFNATGTRLASGSDDLNVILWDWTTGEQILVYESGHRSNVFQAKFMPLGGDCLVISCARDGQVRLAELSTTGVCKGTRKLAQHHGAAHKLALEPDSPFSFLSCAEDAVVYEIDLRESKPEKLVICKENERKVPLYSIFASPANAYEFATGGRDHFIRVYDKRRISNGRDGVLKKYCPHHLLNSDIRANITCLVYNYNGSEILASYNDEDIYTFNATHSDGADFIRRYEGHRNNSTVKGVNYFGPHGEFIISGSDCGNIFFWDTEMESVVQFMAGDEGGVVNCLEPHPNIPVLATSGLDDDVKIWVPSCESPPKLNGLKSIMCANQKEREEDRSREPEAIDGQMLWFLMHHFRRTARRRARLEGQHVDDSSSDDENTDSDDSEDMPHAVQCSTS